MFYVSKEYLIYHKNGQKLTVDFKNIFYKIQRILYFQNLDLKLNILITLFKFNKTIFSKSVLRTKI